MNHGRKGAQLLGMDRLPSTPPAIAAGALCLQLPRMCCCRHHAALVSRRWYAAAHVPDVLRSISSYGSTPARLPSLAAWLLRHGRHMQSFGLFCHKGNSDAGLFAWELSACLGALATASSLQQLRVHFNCAGTALRITSWCAALRQLQQIDLTASSSFLRISSSLAGLVAVTRLELSGDAIIVGAEAQLPPNVEQLQLKDSESEALPQQVSPLDCCEVDGWRLAHLCTAPRPYGMQFGSAVSVAHPRSACCSCRASPA